MTGLGRRALLAQMILFEVALFWLVPVLRGQSPQPGKSINVHISTKKQAVQVGESLSIDVEIENAGEEGILVCNSINPGPGLPCQLHIWIEDVQGNKVPELAFVVDMPPPNPNESLLDVLLRLWLPLKPKHALRSVIPFYPSNKGEPLKAGRYRIRSSYSSYGFDAPGSISPNLTESEDLSRLPYPVFHGRVDSNSIPILVLSSGK